MKLKSVFFVLLSVLFFTACKDTDQLDSSFLPDEGRLRTYSNMVHMESASMLVDSALSRSNFLFLGEYADDKFERTIVEFMSQLDARLGANGLTIPDTTVSSSAHTSGIYYNLLTQKDPNYGPITKVSNPRDVRVDSVFFVIQYSDDLFGDSAAIQGVKVYALNKTLEPSANRRYYTNMDVSDFCNKDTLLGELSYTLEGNRERELRIPLNKDSEFGKRLAKVYKRGSTIKNQTDFNNFFKGVYVSHDFGGGCLAKECGGCIMRISGAGIQLYYSFSADATTTYEGEEVVESMRFERNSIILSANRAVERVNLVKHIGLREKFSSLQNPKATYTFTPAGLYTAVNIPFETMVDSIKEITESDDMDKIMFNSARLTLFAKTLDWKTDFSKTPNLYMLLIDKDSVISFFHKNKSPDGITSFISVYNSVDESYTFDMTRAAQNKLSERGNSFSENMVMLPIVLEQVEGVNFYRQQLWMTATMLHGHGAESEDEAKKPRIDIVYTQRR